MGAGQQILVCSGGSGSFASPSSIPSVWEWWEAEREGLADNTAMSQFTGQVNARHFVQATSGNQPTLRTNIVNGKAAVRFAGSPRHFTGPDMSGLINVHCFLVVKTDNDPNTSSTTDGLWKMGETTFNDQYSDDAGTHPIRTGAFQNSTIAMTYTGSVATWRVFEVICQPGVATPNGRIYRLDGFDLNTSGNGLSTAFAPVTPFLGKSHGSVYLVGYIAGVYLFSSRLADGGADRNNMVSYINSTFGLAMV